MTLILSLLCTVLAAATAYYRAQVSEQRQSTDTYRDRWQSMQTKVLCRDRQIEELHSWCRQLNATKKRMRRRLRGLVNIEKRAEIWAGLAARGTAQAEKTLLQNHELHKELKELKFGSWRLLNNGEKLQDGDEWWSRDYSEWTPVLPNHGIICNGTNPIRRKLASTKPSWRLLNVGEEKREGDAVLVKYNSGNDSWGNWTHPRDGKTYLVQPGEIVRRCIA